MNNSITLLVVKIFAFIVRILLSLRYKVKIKGAEILRNSNPSFILPNHQALVDPILLFSHIYRYSSATPVITSGFYDNPFLKPFLKRWGAIRVSDLESGSRNVGVLNEISRNVLEGFGKGKNIILYPAGQLAGQGLEKIINKKSAHHIVSEIPDDVKVIGVRINGLWGSMWSRAWIGKTPDFTRTLLKSVFYVLANLIFFLPRRKVTIEFVEITDDARVFANKDRKSFNDFLESFYNQNGEEPVLFLKHYFYGSKPKRKLPDKIFGSEKEEKYETLPVDWERIDQDTFEKVQELVATILKIEKDQVKQLSHLKNDLGADSLTLVEIVSELETQFKTFSPPQINDIKTVGDLCLVALGFFSSDSDLKESDLDRPLSSIKNISVRNDVSILEQFINEFTTNKKDPFVYDAMLGSTNKKTFFLKACVVSGLIKQKVRGKHVGIMLPALQSTTLLIAASYLAGKVPVMLNWTVGKKVLEHCVELAEVEVILSAGGFISKIEEQLSDSIKDKLILLEKEVPKISLAKKLKGVLFSFFPGAFAPKFNMDDTAVILFTSGSEAMPKAVPLTHQNIVSDLHGVFSLIKLQNNLNFLGFLPPFHSFGFTVLSILPLVTGVKIAYSPDPTDAREILKILKHTKSNLMVGTPGFLKLMMNVGSEYYFKSIRYMVSGAEAMPASIKEQFDRITQDAILIEGYGITECAPVLTLNLLEKQKLNSVGKFIPCIESMILNLETGNPSKTGEVGMIYVRGENVFNAYLGKEAPDPFEVIEGEKWYKTGDLGYLDEEGFLFITGRLKRFIKIAGEMISLPFIENILLDKYGEEETRVLAVEGSDQITPPQIVLFTSKSIDLDETNNYLLKNGVASIAKIRQIIKLEEIPMLGSGKTDYKVLKAMIK